MKRAFISMSTTCKEDHDFSTRPQVSFVIRTYNEQKWLGAVLKKIYQQTFRKFEIIIVDSGSTDGTLKILDRYPINTIIHIQKTEFNYADAINVGIEQAKGEFIGIVSGHSVPISRTWLQDGLRHFIHPEVAAVGGFDIPLPDAVDEEKRYAHEIQESIKVLQHNTPWLSNTNSLIRKSCWNEYCFDEGKPGVALYDVATQGCEDYDWACEMIARGFRIVKDPLFTVYHSHGGLHRETRVQKAKKWSEVCALIDTKQRPSISFTKLDRNCIYQRQNRMSYKLYLQLRRGFMKVRYNQAEAV